MSERVLIGAHLSTSQGFPTMLQTAVDVGANCVQLFTSSPQQWRAKQYTKADGGIMRRAQEATGVGPLISHDSYLINLASADPEMLEKSRQAFREEITRCSMLGVPMVVTHLGAYKGATLDEGLARLAESLNLLIPLAEDAGVQIVLENTAGQGTYLGGDITQFPKLFSMIPLQDRLGVCFDTCHAFVAGYDIRDAEQYERMMQEFDQLIGLDRLKVIHLNDTDKALGSHNDRHAGIGKGLLGEETFQRIMRDRRLVNVPKILETPGGIEHFAEYLQLLRALAA